MESKLKMFNRNDFKQVHFNNIYQLEGLYETKRDFELIYPKLEEHRDSNYIDYMYIQNNGKINFGTGSMVPDITKHKEIQTFNGVLVKEGDKYVIFRKVVLHPVLGVGGYEIKKQKILIENRRLYIQDGNNCLVYKLVD
ncbi:hypothetical protein HX13_15355 [Chryseobacterium sp. P1-3]|uniref:Uncharacterized protein n=2 Tax=Chryseobacterium gallinarum TaxID=1324352 RepID=A0A0G3M7F7_CHRGL|nr:hypothetical protein [Chryseobacterium sp. P1-3]AKK74854.1 hypothetical protein OK18_08250 [Chryseobacterium gallinarum]KFF73928.1 hypothetical protein HX13_15355 [Chryseobacterium sp. P1-3]